MSETKLNILIADDEKDIRDVLTLLLNSEGYNVISANNGEEVIKCINENIDLYILDINMPIYSGYHVASKIREIHDAPIIFLTAYSSDSDKVMGFSVGADDYIVKPFSNIELLMRVKARLKRYKNPNQTTNNSLQSNRIPFIDVFLDLDSMSIIKDNEQISLTYTEFKILELLLKNKKKIFSLDEIYQKIWNDSFVGYESVMVHIKNIRKKLNDNSREPKYIKTAWGRGYYVD